VILGIVVTLFQTAFLVIYGCLDFVVDENDKKLRERLRALLILLIVGAGGVQAWLVVAAERQAGEDRHTIVQLSSHVTEANDQLRATRKDLSDSKDELDRIARARQDDLQTIRLQYAQKRAEDAARASKVDASQSAVDVSTPLPLLHEQLVQHVMDYNRKQDEAKRAAGEAAAAAAVVNTAKQNQEEQYYTADIAHVFYFSLARLRDLIISEATTNGYTVSTNRLPVALANGRGQQPPPPQLPTEIRMFLPQVPLNIVHAKEEGSIQFPGKALWKIHLSDNDDIGGPFVMIEFTDSTGSNSGKFTFLTYRDSGRKPGDKLFDIMAINYEQPNPPLVDLSAFSGEHDLADYEPLLHRALTTIIRVQLAQSMSFTNAAVQPLKK
jgi:hypothetical protein